MKYLVVSDNHGDREILVELAARYRDTVDRLLHCGDSELSPNDPLWTDFEVVRGNCDYDPAFPEKRIIKTAADTLFMTHGHLFNVRFGLTSLALEAEACGATIALFGHTHEIGCEMHQQVLFLNPGSISQPRGAIQIQSYALIESRADAYEVQYYDRTHQLIPQLHFLFKK